MEDDDDDFDDVGDVAIAKQNKQSKPPSHFAIKTSERFGMRHQFDSAFSLEPFIRGQQGVLDNPLAIRSSSVAGGLVSVYKFDDTAWTTSFETKQHFQDFYAHTTNTAYNLQSGISQSFDLGDRDWAIVPRFRIGYQWASDPRQERWKFQLTAPVGYQATDTLLLMPFMPKLSYQPYTGRPDHRADLTLNMSVGIRYEISKSGYLQVAFGFENRWSNVPSVEYSRWILAPQAAFRVTF